MLLQILTWNYVQELAFAELSTYKGVGERLPYPLDPILVKGMLKNKCSPCHTLQYQQAYQKPFSPPTSVFHNINIAINK